MSECKDNSFFAEKDRMLENNTQKVSTQKYISFAKSIVNSGMSIGKAVEILANSGSSPDEPYLMYL